MKVGCGGLAEVGKLRHAMAQRATAEWGEVRSAQ